MRLVLLLLPLLALSCYTRLNHPQIRDESRLFTPDRSSDCRSCHAGEAWLEDWDRGGYPFNPHEDQDRWADFRSQPWWTAPTPAPGYSAAADSAATPSPQAPRAVVMGQPDPGPRHAVAAEPDSAAAKPDPPARKPAPRKRNRKPADPVDPAPADTARKGS